MRNDFDAGKSITRAIVRALNIKTFLGLFNGPLNGFYHIKIIMYGAVKITHPLIGY